MPRQKTERKHGGGADMEEVRPRLFRVFSPTIHRFLKDEGTFKGTLFTLTTWRRDGLMARLREQGFLVRTLEDQVAALPPLPPAVPIGNPAPYTVRSTDRYSHFDPLRLAWVPDTPQEREGQHTVLLHEGWVVRYRRGRGAASNAQVFINRAGIAHLHPLSDLDALLAGYAQVALVRTAPLKVQQDPTHVYLPGIVLPPPHHRVIERIATQTERGWKAEKTWWSLARGVYESLGLRLVSYQARNKGQPPHQP